MYTPQADRLAQKRTDRFLLEFLTRKNAKEWHVQCFCNSAMNDVEELSIDKSNLVRGVFGALIGAALGVGAMFAFYTLAGFRFPLLGVGIGILTGFCAKLLFKGGTVMLGYISSGIALVAVVATLFLMYGAFPMMSIISVIVSASVAYRIAAN